jgi:hypothetical protein
MTSAIDARDAGGINQGLKSATAPAVALAASVM